MRRQDLRQMVIRQMHRGISDVVGKVIEGRH